MPNSNFDMSTVTADRERSKKVDVFAKATIKEAVSGFFRRDGTIHDSAWCKADPCMWWLAASPACFIPIPATTPIASGDFVPTFFGSQYVTGNTDMNRAFHLPPESKPLKDAGILRPPVFHSATGCTG